MLAAALWVHKQDGRHKMDLSPHGHRHYLSNPGPPGAAVVQLCRTSEQPDPATAGWTSPLQHSAMELGHARTHSQAASAKTDSTQPPSSAATH